MTTALKRLTKIVVGCILIASASLSLTSRAHAATLNVVAGTDAINANGQCQLSEAIQNINDQAATNADCGAGDGSNDTINLPSGTVTLSGNLAEIGQSVTIRGQGMDTSIISGGGQYRAFVNSTNDISVSLQNMTLTAWSGMLLQTSRGDVSLTNVEIDGSGANVGSDGVMTIGNIYPETNDVIVENIYIHDIAANDSYIHILNVWSKGGGTTNALADGVTINNVSNAGGGVNVMVWGVGVMRTEDAFGNFNGSIRNTTINNVSSSTGTATIVSMAAVAVENETATTELAVENATITNIDSGASVFGVDGSFGSFGASLNGTTIADANLTAKNLIISNNLYGGNSRSCSANNDISFLVGGSGTPSTSITSLGGNISDENSCASYFTQPTDKNNVDPADLKLGTLSNHGGSVPTIPLGEGSIAIDAGVTVLGLTTDARGVTRPQCSAFDSGAYEYNGACPAPQQLTYSDSVKGSTVTLVLPSDVTSPSVSAIDPKSLPADSAGSYPLGLTSFQFTTTAGATKTVTLYYDLPGNPSDYTARKYKTNSQTYIDVPGATITREDYNGKSMLKLTYQITDGGILDQDGVANGTVIDPVGLATNTLAETGENLWVIAFSIFSLLSLGVYGLRLSKAWLY